MPDHVFRALTEFDWQAFAEVRLCALRTEPGVFSANHDVEQAKDEAWWRARIVGDGHQVFAAFAGERLIGTIGVFTFSGDPTGETAIIGMLYVDPGHRGKDVAKGLLAVVLAWVRARPRFRRVTVGHRASNIGSMRAIRHHGFVQFHRGSHEWPDGTVEDEVDYILVV